MNGKKSFEYLRPETARVLRTYIEEAPFLHKYVLVGGSGLSFHLDHRKSEDLDFFTYAAEYEKKEIIDFLANFSTKEIVNETDEQIDLVCDGVKVTFFNAKWGFIAPDKVERFNIASIEALAAIFEQAKRVVEGITYKLFCI